MHVNATPVMPTCTPQKPYFHLLRKCSEVFTVPKLSMKARLWVSPRSNVNCCLHGRKTLSKPILVRPLQHNMASGDKSWCHVELSAEASQKHLFAALLNYSAATSFPIGGVRFQTDPETKEGKHTDLSLHHNQVSMDTIQCPQRSWFRSIQAHWRHCYTEALNFATLCPWWILKLTIRWITSMSDLTTHVECFRVVPSQKDTDKSKLEWKSWRLGSGL